MRRKDESSHQQQLHAAKSAYKHASAEGNRQEEARWANVIGDILKQRGEYVEALRWLRKDYEISLKYLPEKHMLPTCQSIGEIYLRLLHYNDALIYQKKHLELAKDANDLTEQQRACTQLGRTYHEIFLKSEDDHYSVRNAKKYFESAMKLAKTLKVNPSSQKDSFVKEYIDAHNNLGMLEIDLDNLDEAEKILTKGLEICDEEEVVEDDDARSRLHHNLGNVYMELRRWEKAHNHIKKDITICRKISHCQGEAKGYINLGELHYRNQKYNEAISSYQKALELAKSMEDEDALADQINQNIQTVRQAMKVLDELKKEEQNLKKLERNMEMVRGTEGERSCLLKQNKSLDCLIEKSRMIFVWIKLREYAKKNKRISSELCDKEKLSDSYLVIGESYQKLRKFSKALKWFRKGWETHKSIGNLEGQALAKINMGNILDSSGDFAGALDAFKEGYRTAVQANLSSVQLSALENMHYSYMIRFDDIEEARRTKCLIKELKESTKGEIEDENLLGNSCSETKTELDYEPKDYLSDGSFSPNTSERKSNTHDEDIPLRSLFQSNKRLAKQRRNASPIQCGSTDSLTGSQSRKRVRVILSDDDEGEGMATSDECEIIRLVTGKYASSPVHEAQIVSPVASRCTVSREKSTGSEKSGSYKLNSRVTGKGANLQSHGNNVNSTCVGSSNLFHNDMYTSHVHACCDEPCKHLIFKIDEDLVHMDLDSHGALDMEQMKVELACLYYLQLSSNKRSRGLVPVIQHMKYDGKILESLEALYSLRDHATVKAWIEVSIVMVPKRLMKLYIDCCDELSVPPNLKVVRKLYNLQVSDDVIVVSDCELQDVSVAPLLNALQLHKTLAVLDLSHNLLGNETAEALKQVFMSSGQSYGGLVLDLHNNQLGPTALFQLCECPMLYARLEVLNISGNCLTDGCASYLTTILKTCKALYTMNIENCSITSITVQRIADSLDSESVLTHLCLGYNRVSRPALTSLLLKLATLKRFQELNLNGIKLSKPMVDCLCQLARDCYLSGLMLGHTNIGNDCAIQLINSLSKDTQELVRLDMSFCGLTHHCITSLSDEGSLIASILELNISGNPIKNEGCPALSSLLRNPSCCLRVLVVSKCQLGLDGMVTILEALSENCSLEELNMAENVVNLEEITDTLGSTNESRTNFNNPHSLKNALPQEMSPAFIDANENQLEVPDSEDELIGVEAPASGLKDDNLYSSMLLQKLVHSIRMAVKLQQLNLSRNDFSQQFVEMLFLSWSLGGRANVAQKHVEDTTIHFSVQGNKCCGMKPCCTRI